VPETYVVKGDGTIAYKFVGPLTDETLKSVLLPQIRKAEG
jgi:cytochrome c biogenesis protein CcmG/thiol:disulfide interchange protein DsbE